jgi:hypothetical protein
MTDFNILLTNLKVDDFSHVAICKVCKLKKTELKARNQSSCSGTDSSEGVKGYAWVGRQVIWRDLSRWQHQTQVGNIAGYVE